MSAEKEKKKKINAETQTPNTHAHEKKKKMNTLDRVRFKGDGPDQKTINTRKEILERIQLLQHDINNKRVSGEMVPTGSWGFFKPREELKTYNFTKYLRPNDVQFRANRALDDIIQVLERSKFSEDEKVDRELKDEFKTKINELKKYSEQSAMEMGELDSHYSRETDRATAESLMMMGRGY